MSGKKSALAKLALSRRTGQRQSEQVTVCISIYTIPFELYTLSFIARQTSPQLPSFFFKISLHVDTVIPYISASFDE